MDAFEPLINLLVLLGTLSIAAERLANLTKLAHPDLARRRGSQREEKDRERRIGNRVILVSVLLATAIKADFFAIMAHLDAPWQTLGWSRGAAPGSFAALLGTLAGTILTGLSLGFGSKFWHDALDILYGARRNLRRLGGRAQRSAGGA
ncbi:MAG TPA: hypothetical protein VJL31_19305 [Gemmatimonadales bacterium]|jgi:hypothetical protein|nr:hypothetical protein [Gemmatimonadales bacterium]